jgi:hypothetical protein
MKTTTTSRLLSQLRLLVSGVLLALPLACWQVSHAELAVAGAVLECPVGSEGCPCTAGGGCDPGLICMSGYCSSSGGGYDDEITVYEFEDDLAEPMPVIETARSVQSLPGVAGGRGRKERPAKLERQSRKARNTEADFKSSDANFAPEGSSPAPKPAPISVVDSGTTSEDPAPEEELDDDGRQVIYTADLQIAVYELDAAIEFAESLPQRYGGWIESRYDYQITLRIPAERLFEAIDQLGALGLVLGKTLRADDVTDEYTDLESRILVLEQLVEQLELLLAKAKTVEEALKIRIELDRVRIELEAARVRMRQLSELIDFSTLTLHFSQRGSVDALPASNDPFPWVDDLGVETTEYR